MTCTFFGHREIFTEIQPKLQSTLVYLIENKNVDTFYVGNNGKFDYMVIETLKSLKVNYPNIFYYVVLAYLPNKKNNLESDSFIDTIYPEGLEKVPRKYAISKRNEWACCTFRHSNNIC